MVAKLNTTIKATRKRKVPDYLVKEEIDGILFYYSYYKEVLNKKQKLEDVMGCSAIQSLVIQYLMKVMFKNNIDSLFYIFTNETGNHLSHKNNLQFDIALYDKKLLTPEKITDKYVQEVAPHIVFEIDTDVSLDDTGFQIMQDYYFTKTQKLIEYGTKRIIWIFTKSKKILVAEGKDWHIYDFDRTIEILDGVTFNLDEFLKEEKISL